jgi:hypothetical protein
LRHTAAALVVVCQITACGGGARRYHAFSENTDRVRVGMAESEVRTIMGAPSRSPTGNVLVADCGQAAASALVYDFIQAGRFERWAASIIGSHPQLARFIVCLDAGHIVVKKDTQMIMID